MSFEVKDNRVELDNIAPRLPFLNELVEHKGLEHKEERISPTEWYERAPLDLLREIQKHPRPGVKGIRQTVTIPFGMPVSDMAKFMRRVVKAKIRNANYEYKTLVVNFSINGVFQPFQSKKKLQKKMTYYTKIGVYEKLAKNIEWVQIRRGDYATRQSIQLKFLPIPDENPEIKNYRDGDYNCACAPVLEHLRLKNTVKNKKAIVRVDKINTEVFKDGIDAPRIERLAKTSFLHIIVYDMASNLWQSFNGGHKHKIMLFRAHNGHLTRITACELKSVDFNLFNTDQTVEWKEPGFDYYQLQHDLNEFNTVEGRNGTVGLITHDVIYKTKYYEYEQYPDVFGDAGVGKAKFLKQHPWAKPGIKSTDKFYDIYFDADRPGFSTRNGNSDMNNIKLDMNSAFKSFKQSNIFKGFPNLEGLFVVDKKVSEFDGWTHHGLLYILSPRRLDAYQPLYYEGPGWYPIEIVKYIYDRYQIDPLIKAFAYGSTSFDVNFNAFTNAQFRSFRGKTIVKQSTSTWRTSSSSEYLRALYSLQDKVIGTTTTTERGVECNTITYKNDKQPWQLPVVSVYVLAHQKMQLFDQYNKCLTAGVKPVSVSTDSIEIAHADIEKALPLFDMGSKIGQYKIEEMKRVDHPEARNKSWTRWFVETPLNLTGATKYDASLIMPRLVHFSGAGGNGKTEKLIELAKIYPNLLVCVPEHALGDDITTRGAAAGLTLDVNTYHKIFTIKPKLDKNGKVIKVPSQIPPGVRQVVFDECSKIPAEHLIAIDHKLREHCNNQESFGGLQIILCGDFWQLPPFKDTTPLHNTWTGYKHPLYKQFTEIEFTKNWRQQNDSKYFELCSAIRPKMTATDAKQIIKQLNTRVLPLPAFDTIHDVFIAGTNEQLYEHNNIPMSTDVKVIAQYTGRDMNRKKISNGKIGVVCNTSPLQIRWPDNSISEFGPERKGARARFLPAIGLTVHKSQGKTFKRNVVINPTRLFARNHLYVALTRATSFDSIYLTAPITFGMFCKTVYVKGYTRS